MSTSQQKIGPGEPAPGLFFVELDDSEKWTGKRPVLLRLFIPIPGSLPAISFVVSFKSLILLHDHAIKLGEKR
jgi:hypothetical protein